MLKNALMNGKEINKLIETGITTTSSGYLVKLRTGTKFGDPLKLFLEVSTLAKKIREAYRLRGLKNMPNDILRDSVDKSLLQSISEFGNNTVHIISDARVIDEIRKHFLFLSGIKIPIVFRQGVLDFRPASLLTSEVKVDHTEGTSMVFGTGALSISLVGNTYFNEANSSLTNTLMVAPLGLSYVGSYAQGEHAIGWWFYYIDLYLGFGANYTLISLMAPFGLGRSHGSPMSASPAPAAAPSSATPPTDASTPTGRAASPAASSTNCPTRMSRAPVRPPLQRDRMLAAPTVFPGQFPLTARRPRTVEAWEQPARPPRADAIPVGARVFHQKFGYGIVTAAETTSSTSPSKRPATSAPRPIRRKA